MSFELLGIKSTTLIPAAGGAIAYALRAAEQSILARVTIGTTGFLTAAFISPPIVQLTENHYAFTGGVDLTGGITFTIGALGGLLVGVGIGIAKDPLGAYKTFRGK